MQKEIAKPHLSAPLVRPGFDQISVEPVHGNNKDFIFARSKISAPMLGIQRL